MRLNGETYGCHFGFVPKIIMEGGLCKYHDPTTGEVICIFMSHFSDDAQQHVYTSFENMKTQLQLLKDRESLSLIELL